MKKKYNHLAVESDFLKTNYFQKIYATKKGGTQRDNMITQFPIHIAKDIQTKDIEQLIKESVLATYLNMKGEKTTLLPIFDTELKDLDIQKYRNLLIKAGIFFDIDTDNIVYSERNTNFVRNLFVELVEKGSIYEDFSINYRSIQEQKTLGADEIQRKKMQVKQYHIRYFVDTKNISLVVPTIRPETIFADVALAVNPNDKRYKKLIGHKVIIPIINKTIPIIGDESINSDRNNGIMRITPAHDNISLEIAKRNGLKINSFAIDKNGDFTKCAGDFCGKSAKEFTNNIVKNLDDIHNLESAKTIETDIAVHRKTQEKARPLLCNQLFIKVEGNRGTLETAAKQGMIELTTEKYPESMIDIDNEEMSVKHRPVTKEDTRGYCLPLRKGKNGKNYFLSDNNFLNLPAKKSKGKLTVLSLIIFNLIVDRRLKQHFSIEECIDTLLGKNRTGEQSTLETYGELFSETLPRGYSKELNELKKIWEYAQKEKGNGYFEKFSIGLIEMLEKSVGIGSKKKGFYYLDINMFGDTDDELIMQKEKIEETLGNSLILTKIVHAFKNSKKQPKKIFSIDGEKTMECMKTMMVGQEIQESSLFDVCRVQASLQEKKEKEGFKEVLKQYGTDCTRLYAIDRKQTAEEYEQFLNKLRNASRFVIQHRYDKKGTRKIPDFSQLTTQLEKKKGELEEFEIRITHRISELQKEYEEYMGKGMIEDAQERLIRTIKEDFCDKYLETQKYSDTEHGTKVTIRSLGNLIKMLYPFAPFITQQIRSMMEFEGPIANQYFDKEINISKNYKTQLFMDIIDRFMSMKEKNGYAKHEEIEICFLAPLDFLQYLKKQEQIISRLLHAKTIEYLENEKELNGYHTESIINITIGIKKERKSISIEKKEDIHSILREKEQRLQSIRSLIPGLSANGADPELIRQKKREMTKLKKEIEEIHYEIQKQKFRK